MNGDNSRGFVLRSIYIERYDYNEVRFFSR